MTTLEVNQIIDNARFTRFHWMVMCLCGLLLIFDGYDLFIYGAVLPVLMKEWGLTPVQAGALGSYALFGMMFGAFVFGPLADRIGRKKGGGAQLRAVQRRHAPERLCDHAQRVRHLPLHRGPGLRRPDAQCRGTDE